jgi:hypothetical protein
MIEVIKQMIEALEWCHGGEPIGTAEAIKAGKKLMAELEQRTWVRLTDEVWKREIDKVYMSDVVCLDKETVEKIENGHRMGAIFSRNPSEGSVVFYKKREWVGLTNEEVKAFDTWHDNREEEVGWCNPSEIVAYIEAKLKQKNGFAEEKNT